MQNSFLISQFESFPVVGILRGFRREQITPIVDACRAGGLANLEVTMNTSGATDQIRIAVERAEGAMNIGAGTVTSLPLLEQALEAGASFIVTPVVQAEVLEKCREWGVPVFPGAFTPTEIHRAWELGATMVKVFPADVLGPSYIRSVKAPLPEIKLLPTGAVSLENLSAYLQAGADGFGVGSPFFHRQRIDEGDWGWVTEQCRAFSRFFRK